MDILKAIFENIDFPNDPHCCGCEFDEVTEDGYSTGDSPDAHDCQGSPEDCPAAKNELIRAYNHIMPASLRNQAV